MSWSKLRSHWKDGFALLLLLALFGLLVLPRAWVTDDAYVTFRVVDNAVHGYGLRWNIDERVQAYTNPLWMLLHIPFYALSGNIYLTTLAISLVCGVLAIWLAARCVPAIRILPLLLLFALLFSSDSLKNFLMSGLEVPLIVLLYAWFAHTLLQPSCSWFKLALIVSLAFVNRMDSVLLMLPAVLFLAWQNRRKIAWGEVLAGGVPALGWITFCGIYYGFLFPNTKYAKLNTGLTQQDYWKQGIAYIEDLMMRDSVALAVILAALFVTAYLTVAVWERRKAPDSLLPTLWLFGLGVALSCLYVVTVGGDFMSGRFFIPAFFAGSILVYALASAAFGGPWIAVLLMAVATLKFCNLFFYTQTPADKNGIVEERLFYYQQSGLWNHPQDWIRREPVHPWGEYGKQALHDPRHKDGVAVFSNIGFYGFYAGPGVRIIDGFGLADPLIARLPMPPGSPWRIGHFGREIPAGYYLARRNGDMSQMTPEMARYYEKLRLVISGSLWSWERLKTIVNFQLGRYDGLVARKVP